MKVIRYEKKYKTLWNDFINKSKNGTFLFYRNYMEYHSDRFKDFSIMFFIDDELIAVLPANLKDNKLYSHEGLTFGGIISDQRMKTSIMLEIFDELIKYLNTNGITTVIYKAIPSIYHIIPAEEDCYALFKNNAKIIRMDVSSAIFMSDRKIPFNKGRKWSIKQSKKFNLELKKSSDFKTFRSIEAEVLRKKYGIKPVHTAEELQLLEDRFPENIKLFTAYKDNEMVAGVIVYESKNVAHTQYVGSTDEGKELCAQDFILDFLINNYYKDKTYFDFGISTENMGQYLNEGLVRYKESYGARAIVYNFYELNLK